MSKKPAKQHQQYGSYDDRYGIGELHDKPGANPWASKQIVVGGRPSRRWAIGLGILAVVVVVVILLI